MMVIIIVNIYINLFCARYSAKYLIYIEIIQISPQSDEVMTFDVRFPDEETMIQEVQRLVVQVV